MDAQNRLICGIALRSSMTVFVVAELSQGQLPGETLLRSILG